MEKWLDARSERIAKSLCRAIHPSAVKTAFIRLTNGNSRRIVLGMSRFEGILMSETALNRPCRRRLSAIGAGFTLIELLIVVAIISILAAIAVPNFLEAQTRAKVSRVHADARTIATGLESYAVDYSRYPPRQVAGPSTGFFLVGDVETRAEDMSVLTTPLQYLSSLPIDVFENRIAYPNAILDYWSAQIVSDLIDDFTPRPPTSQYGWTVFSIGPDQLFGYGDFQTGNYPEEDNIAGPHFLLDYDPTNGTISVGNVYRFQSQVPAKQVFER